MDFHCDGKVNYSEFLAATISTINFNKEEKLWSAFKYFDTTDSGYITLDSVMDALKDSGVIIDEEGLKKTFNELQKKGKKINFNEFKAIALGNDVVEEENDFSKDIKDEQDNKNKNNSKINLKLNLKNIDEEIDDNENKIKRVETVFVKEERKESQDIFFEKVNFSTNNYNYENLGNKENTDKKENINENKENNAQRGNQNINKDNKDSKDNNNSNVNKNNSNNKNNSKNNKSSKSNNKSSKSNNNKSSKSYNKSSKSNNKSSKSNMEVLLEEPSIDNNDKFTEVNENIENQN